MAAPKMDIKGGVGIWSTALCTLLFSRLEKVGSGGARGERQWDIEGEITAGAEYLYGMADFIFAEV